MNDYAARKAMRQVMDDYEATELPWDKAIRSFYDLNGTLLKTKRRDLRPLVRLWQDAR